jgi:hypothetical protein
MTNRFIVSFLFLIVSAVSTISLARPEESNPSLEETLTWLKEFLPTATAAKYSGNSGLGPFSLEASLDIISGCQVRVAQSFVDLGEGPSMSFRTTDQFSLAEIDPTTVATVDAGSYGHHIVVLLKTRSHAKSIIDVYDGPSG